MTRGHGGYTHTYEYSYTHNYYYKDTTNKNSNDFMQLHRCAEGTKPLHLFAPLAICVRAKCLKSLSFYKFLSFNQKWPMQVFIQSAER